MSRSSASQQDERAQDESVDDEKFKGHPLRSGSGNTITSSSTGRFTPTSWFGSRDKERERDHQPVFDDPSSMDDEDDDDGMNASRESILDDLGSKNGGFDKGKGKAKGKGKSWENGNGYGEFDRSPIFDEDLNLDDDELTEKEKDGKRRERRNENSSFSGRKTPKVYRPLEESSRKNSNGTGNQNGNSLNYYDESQSEISISMTNSISNGSLKIVNPLARHGSINLSSSSSKKKSKRSKKQKKPSPTLLSDLSNLYHSFRAFLTLLKSPNLLFSNVFESLSSSVRALDESFRNPITGRRTFKPTWFEAYIPLLIWLGISLSSTILVLSFHTEVFGFLDRLASGLREMGWKGEVGMGALIFITTFREYSKISTCPFADSRSKLSPSGSSFLPFSHLHLLASQLHSHSTRL